MKRSRFGDLAAPPTSSKPHSNPAPKAKVVISDDEIPHGIDLTPKKSALDEVIGKSWFVMTPEIEKELRPELEFAKPHFRYHALDMYDTGWMPIPQTRTDRRHPGRVDGEVIKWGQYQTERPPREEIAHWAQDGDAAMCNAAILLGSVSGNTFAVDVDVTDKILSFRAVEIIEEVLGKTMQRTGNAPKTALFYRVETSEDLPASQKFQIADEAGTGPSGHVVEILSQGHLITAMGLHWKTRNDFKWRRGMPPTHGPEKATLVTPEQIRRCYDRLAAEIPMYTRAHAAGGDGIITEAGNHDGIRGVHVAAFGAGSWVEKDGLVFDGREAFLWSVVKAFAKRNDALPDERIPALKAAIKDHFRQQEHPDRRWPEARLDDEIHDKVRRAGYMLAEGRLKPVSIARKADGTAAAPIQRTKLDIVHDHDEFEWLPKRRAAVPVAFSKPDPVKAEQRRLRTDRDAHTQEASDKLDAAINAAIDDMIAGEPRIHVIKGATGLGKTSRTMKLIGQRHDEIFAPSEDGEERGPLVFIVPTYRNVGELRDKCAALGLDPEASDEDLMAAAAELGLVADGDVASHIEDLRRTAAGTPIADVVNSGKVKGGCLVPEKMKALQRAHIPTAGLCKGRAPVKDSYGRIEGWEETFCPHYSECPVIQQRQALKRSDLVFMVRNFLTLPLPEELQNVRGVVVDERIFDRLIATTTLDLKTLEIGRREPALTKKEKEAGIDPVDLLQSREQASEIAVKALKVGDDVARTFVKFEETINGKTITGADLVADARRVCGSAMTSQADLHPMLTQEEIDEICARPTGTQIGEEYRFWKLVEEEMKAVQAGFLDSTKAPQWDRDCRIRLLNPSSDDAQISISWSQVPNWRHVPMLLLDASTDPELTRRTLGAGREIVTHEVPVSLNMRTVAVIDRRLSNRSLFPGPQATAAQKKGAADQLHAIRNIVSTICGVHANGRVVVAMPMRLQRAVLLGWAKPENSDWLHHGAVAGLDFARNHEAVIAIGRIELPNSEIDGLVAAASYGDQIPEPPIDPDGTGVDRDGKPIYPSLVRRCLPMRDGRDAEYDCQQHVGDLARRIQFQYREEELRQIIGRIRPVYRDRPATVYAITESIPEDLIVDDIVSFDDLARYGKFWDAVRLNKGIISAQMLHNVGDHLFDLEGLAGEIKDRVEDVPVVRRRYSEILVTDHRGHGETVYVPGHYGIDRFNLPALREVLADMGYVSGQLSAKMVRECDCVVEPADVAQPDGIADDLALIESIAGEDMRRIELAEIREIKEALMAKGEWRPGAAPVPSASFGRFAIQRVQQASVRVPTSYKIGDGEWEKMPMSIGSWLALQNFGDIWVERGTLISEESLSPADVEIPIGDDISAPSKAIPTPVGNLTSDDMEFLQAVGF